MKSYFADLKNPNKINNNLKIVFLQKFGSKFHPKKKDLVLLVKKNARKKIAGVQSAKKIPRNVLSLFHSKQIV